MLPRQSTTELPSPLGFHTKGQHQDSIRNFAIRDSYFRIVEEDPEDRNLDNNLV